MAPVTICIIVLIMFFIRTCFYKWNQGLEAELHVFNSIKCV